MNPHADSPAPIRLVTAKPVLLVNDLERSVAYYEQALGFRRQYLLPEAGVAGVYRDSAEIALWLARGAAVRSNQAAWQGDYKPPDVSIVTHSVTALHAEYMANGLVRPEALMTQAGGITYFRLQDCNGYWLAFFQPYLDAV